MKTIEKNIRLLLKESGVILTNSPLQDVEKEQLTLFLQDILEDEVDKKYYLSKEQIQRLIKCGFKEKNISNTIRSGGRNSLDNKHTWDVIKIGNVNPSKKGMNGNVYTGNISPTITTNKGEGIKILQLDVSQIKREGKVRVYENISRTLNTAQGGGHTPLIYQRGHGFNKGGIKKICPTISSSDWHQNNFLMKDATLRRLTPKECFRLMGFLNDEINLDGLSNCQRYKLAGNGFEINLVSKIFKCMFQKTSKKTSKNIYTSSKIITIDKNGNKTPNIPTIGQADRIYDTKGISPSLNSTWTPIIKDSITEDNTK